MVASGVDVMNGRVMDRPNDPVNRHMASIVDARGINLFLFIPLVDGYKLGVEVILFSGN